MTALPAAQSWRKVQSALDLSPEKPRGFSLVDHWELGQEHKRGVFNFRPHTPNDLMITRTEHPNDELCRPFRNLADFSADLAHNELV
jgi:phospholipase A1/A2